MASAVEPHSRADRWLLAHSLWYEIIVSWLSLPGRVAHASVALPFVDAVGYQVQEPCIVIADNRIVLVFS